MSGKQSEPSGSRMVDISKLRSHLLSSGRLTEDQFLQAEDYALTRRISVEEALLFLDLVDYAWLGQRLGEIYEKPYRPLMTEPPPDSAKEIVPLKFAERWKVFPVFHNPEENLLTIAMSDPEDREIVGQLRSILQAPVRLEFTVASTAEIEEAIEVHYKGKAYAPTPDLEVPQDFTILADQQKGKEKISLEERAPSQSKVLLLEPDRARASALRTILRGEGYPHVRWVMSPQETVKALKEEASDLLLVNGRFFQPRGSWLRDISQEIELPHISYYDLAPVLLGQEYSYHQMSEALVGLTAFLVRKALKHDKGRLQEILTRVRYCKLLALRLELRPGQVDGAVLAAWLSAGAIGTELLSHVVTPYRLEEIIEPERRGENIERVEAAILDLVKEYQGLKGAEPDVAKDISRVRRMLSPKSSSPEAEAILEAFLQLIQGEEFLREVDQPAGRIIIVDPAPAQGSSMALRLSNDGYEVEEVPDPRKAVEIMSKSKFDLVISEVNMPGADGLKFCRALRKNAMTAHIPFFFVTAEEGERLPSECLEAGADDFLKKPVDLELLSLKIQRLLAMRGPKESKRGVSGSLKEMSSTDFIQSLSAVEKDVEISLEHMGEKGKIYMQQGQIVDANTRGLSGEEAFYRLMTWEEGEFQIIPCSNFPARTIHAPTMSLLIEGARLIDEARDE